MPLLNAFVDSVVCVGFNSERGVTIDPESKNNESFFTSYLQSSILAIITDDRAIYPLSTVNESIDLFYPPIRRLSSHSNSGLSSSSGRSSPTSLLGTGIRTQKQHLLLTAYKDLPFFCFPDGVRATYQPEKEKIHHFVLTQDGKRSYALALTFQQQFTFKTDKPDDDGIYQINDVKSSTLNTGRSSVSKISVAINKSEIVSPPSTSSSTGKKNSKKIPSSFPTPDTNSAKQVQSPSSQDTAKQQSSNHYGISTINSYTKNLPPAAPSLGRARSQGDISSWNTTSTISSSTGMRKRSGSIIFKEAPASTASSSTSLDITKPFYLPHCIVLISTEPYWTALQETISIIHDDITRSQIEPYSQAYKKLIQKYAFLACNTPIPPVPWEPFSLSFNVTNEQFVITFDPPINANRPILDLDLSILLLTLNIGRLLDVLAAIFTEQPIIFFSSNYSTLVTTLECLLYLIYPLKWTNVYIPLVPDGLRDIYLEGPPGLYIKGAHSRHQSIVEELNISCTCNLDNDKNIHIPKHVELHSIPPTKMHSFINPITQLLEEIKVARSLKTVSTAPRLSMEQQRKLKRQQRLETNAKITEIFLVFMIDLCSDAFEPIYWKVNPQQINPAGASLKTSTNDRKNSNLSQTTATIPTFSKEKYLLPKTEGIELEFYRALVESTAFLNLLKEEMSSTSPSGFRQICQIYSLSTEDQLYHFSNTLSEDIDNNHIESTTTLYDSLFSQMVLPLPLPLPDWSTDLPKHYLDSCIELFTNELKNAQRERSPTVISVYTYLRGCARLARGDYIEGLRDLYLIENANLFPRKYIETNIVPRLAEEYLLDLFINESFYTECPEWKKVSLRPKSQSLTVIDLDETKNVVDASPVESSPDVSEEWNIEENTLTYEQFSEHVHRLSIVLDKETTETLFKALLYWTDNSISKTLKTDRTSTNNTNKPSEPMKPSGKPSPPVAIATLQDTFAMLNNPRRKSLTATASLKSSTQSNLSLPTTLFELFLDIWQQTNAEKVRMNHHLPEDRQKQESILKVSSSGIVSKKDGPGQIILTQKRLYFLPEVRSSAHLLTELIDMISVEKYQHQTAFFSSKPGIKIYTSLTSLLPRDNNNIKLKSKTSSLEKGSKLSSISLFFKTNQEQELWYTIIVELWSGLTIAHEQCDTAVLNKASRLIALMDTLANIDYQEEILTSTDRQLTNSHLKSKQHHNEVCLEMALKDLSIFTRMRQTGTLKPLSVETRNVLTRRLTPSINETEHYGVRCLLFTEHPDTGRSSIWCAYGSKLKVFNVTTWICDPNDLCFPSLIASMCLDARFKLWVRCIKGGLFVVDTLTRRCDAELVTFDGENACETIEFDSVNNHILTANRNGTITLWNASDWERLYDINLLEIYNKTHNIQERRFISRAVLTLRSPTNSSNIEKPSNRKQASFGISNEPINPIDMPGLPSSTAPAQIIPSSTDKLERIQIYEDLLFACYRDDYIIILRRSNSDIYTYEHLISVKYKTGDSVLIDSFLAYNKQLWVSTGCIISIFNVNNTNDENGYNLLTKKPIDDENAYNLIMKKSVDDDNLVTMLGFSGYIWAGSLHGKVYVFRMDNYELYKTFAGHRDSVLCLCSMLNTYVVSGSAQNDTSIAIWEHVQTSNVSSTASTTTSATTGGSIFNLYGTSNTPSPKKNDTKGEFFK